MSILVRCPSCRGHFSAPDATAGRKGRCPKCRAAILIPAAAPLAARPRRTVAAAVGLLMLGTVAAGAYYLVTTDTTRTTPTPPEPEPASREVAGPAAVPSGWQEFAPEGRGFRVFLPNPPAEHGPGVYLAQGRDPDITCMVAVQPLPADVPEGQRDALADGLAATTTQPPNRELARRAATLAGRPATERVAELAGGAGPVRPQAVVRAVRFGDRVFTLTITGAAGPPPPALANGFFDNFRLRP